MNLERVQGWTLQGSHQVTYGFTTGATVPMTLSLCSRADPREVVLQTGRG